MPSREHSSMIVRTLLTPRRCPSTRGSPRDRAQRPHALLLRILQQAYIGRAGRRGPAGPRGIDKRQARHGRPFRAQIDLEETERLMICLEGRIANEQGCI